jgi:hypothetical protein
MAIPVFQTLMLPVLKLAAEREVRTIFMRLPLRAGAQASAA